MFIYVNIYNFYNFKLYINSNIQNLIRLILYIYQIIKMNVNLNNFFNNILLQY